MYFKSKSHCKDIYVFKREQLTEARWQGRVTVTLATVYNKKDKAYFPIAVY
jgi:hypothetical protein